MVKNDESSQPRPRKTDHRIKVIFAVLLAAVAVFIVLVHRSPQLPGWGDDLQSAMDQAPRAGRRILVLFTARPPGAVARRLMRATLRKTDNRKAIQDGRFLTVRLEVKFGDDVASQYKITTLPTMLLLSSTGRELNRREGMIGELDFRNGFLDRTKVVEP